MKSLFALALAGIVLTGSAGLAIGDDTVGRGQASGPETSPPVWAHGATVRAYIPHLPGWGASPDPTLLGPEMKTLGAFLLEPTIPAGQFQRR